MNSNPAPCGRRYSVISTKRAFARDAQFGIECPRLIDEIRNPRFHLAHNWKLARDAAPGHVRVKQTVTGPHVLTRFTVNQRPDLYPDEPSVCRAYAKVLTEELKQVVDAACDFIQFDEPMWTESPEHSEWSADILNEMIDQRSDDLESVDEIRERVKPALEFFPPERLILTSECGFGA